MAEIDDRCRPHGKPFGSCLSRPVAGGLGDRGQKHDLTLLFAEGGSEDPGFTAEEHILLSVPLESHGHRLVYVEPVEILGIDGIDADAEAIRRKVEQLAAEAGTVLQNGRINLSRLAGRPVNLPVMEGFDFFGKVSRKGVTVPIVLGGMENEGIGAGNDDFFQIEAMNVAWEIALLGPFPFDAVFLGRARVGLEGQLVVILLVPQQDQERFMAEVKEVER